MILELPLPYGAATAERFAFGAVSLLEGLGCVDLLGFGCESGDLPALQRAAPGVESPEVYEAVLERGGGDFLCRCRGRGGSGALGEAGDALRRPQRHPGSGVPAPAGAAGLPIRPVAVARKGAGHDGGIGEDGFASASFLRARWEDGLEAVLPYLPQQVHGVYKQARAEGRVLDRERWQWMELSGLRTLSIEAFAQGPDLSEGLENRLYARLPPGGEFIGVLQPL